MKKVILSLAGIAGFAAQVYAHPGHGHTVENNFLHGFVEPVHSIPMLLLLGGMLWLQSWSSTAKHRRWRYERSCLPEDGGL